MSRTDLVWLRSLRATLAVLMRVVRPGRMVGHLPVVRRSPPAVYPLRSSVSPGTLLGGWCTEVRGLRIPMAPANADFRATGSRQGVRRTRGGGCGCLSGLGMGQALGEEPMQRLVAALVTCSGAVKS